MSTTSVTGPYVEAVRTALGEAMTHDALTLAETLERMAGPDGRTPPSGEVREASGLDASRANDAFRLIRPTRLLTDPDEDGRLRIRAEVPAPPVPVVVPTPRKPASRVVPMTGIETREPRDQNQHTLAMVNSHQLVKNAQLVAMVASVEIAITAARTKVPFGQAERELSAEYMAGKTGLSKRSVVTAMAGAVKHGFLRRTDNAQGGPRGTNRATYRACLPTYLDV